MLQLALLILLGQILLLPVHAADATLTVAIPSFDTSNINAFQLNDLAQLPTGADYISLTTNNPENQSGSAFWKHMVSLANNRSFSTYFKISFPNPGGMSPGGADGIVFAIQTVSNTAGGSGGGIGYDGLQPSVGIEFDTWQNTDSSVNDPDDNHVGFDVNGVMESVFVAPSASLPGTLQGNSWYVWIDYNGQTKNLQVRMHSSNNRTSSTLVMNQTYDIASVIGPDVFIGFTAGTGGAVEDHNVNAFYFCNDYNPIDTNATPPNNYTQAPFHIVASPSPATIATGSTSNITATVYNVSGAVMANQPVTFTTNLGTLVTTSGTTNASGQVTVTLNSGFTGGTATIRATTAAGVYGETSVVILAPTTYTFYIPMFIVP